MGDKRKPLEIRRLCTVCLCAARATHALGGRLRQYYMHTLSGIQVESEVPAVSPRVCWECEAHLKRSVRFREQARRSHSLLRSAIKSCPIKDINGFLLKKLGRPERLRTCVSHSIIIAPKCERVIAPKCDGDDALMTATYDDDDEDDGWTEPLPVKEEEACDREAPTVLPISVEDNTLSKISAFGETSQVLDKKDSIVNYLKQLDGIEICIKGEVNNDNVCRMCSKAFTTTAELERHIATHNIDNKKTVPMALKGCAVVLCSDDQCRECPKKLRFDVHKIKAKREPFQCSVCSEAFPDKDKLTQHKQTSVACARPFQCEVCAYSFKYFENLKTHMRTHTGEKPFQCDVCQRAFSQKGTLYKHMKLHTGEKPIKCEFCHKRFAEKASLKLHVRVHTGEKPFQCPMCSKKFSQKSNLVEHYMTHTGQKPHACAVCPSAYIRRCDLESHMNTHTGAKPFQCAECSYACATKRSLQGHMRARHKRNTFNVPAHLGRNTFSGNRGQMEKL